MNNSENNYLKKTDLMTLEEYSEKREDFRKSIISHKRNRQVAIGPDTRLYFEDRLTMQYQIQEILRIEKIFESHAIEEELEAYNPLIPNGSNWKATFMIEIPDVDERKKALSNLIGIERSIWIKIDDQPLIYPIANEDLERETEEKTSAVHFLRFELTPSHISALRKGQP